jgi:hypothetical protein
MVAVTCTVVAVTLSPLIGFVSLLFVSIGTPIIRIVTTADRAQYIRDLYCKVVAALFNCWSAYNEAEKEQARAISSPIRRCHPPTGGEFTLPASFQNPTMAAIVNNFRHALSDGFDTEMIQDRFEAHGVDWCNKIPTRTWMDGEDRLGCAMLLPTVCESDDARINGLANPFPSGQLVQPLAIYFGGAHTPPSLANCFVNLCNGVPPNLLAAERFYMGVQRQIDAYNADPTHTIKIVPVFAGISMGGMLAAALGRKYGYSSLGFNALGLGRGVMENFIERPFGGPNERYHMQISVGGDWVSDPLHAHVYRTHCIENIVILALPTDATALQAFFYLYTWRAIFLQQNETDRGIEVRLNQMNIHNFPCEIMLFYGLLGIWGERLEEDARAAAEERAQLARQGLDPAAPPPPPPDVEPDGV